MAICERTEFLFLFILIGFSYEKSIVLCTLKPNDQVFLGSFKITNGDVFTDSLKESQSTLFKEKASTYKNIIDNMYSESFIKDAYSGSEITAFDGEKDDGLLKVNFNLTITSDYPQIRVDAGDLFIIFTDSIRNSNGVLPGNFTVDQDSLEITDTKFLHHLTTDWSTN